LRQQFRETVIDTMVKPISREPSIAAVMLDLPISR